VESTLIVFSVLVALGVDRWREERELQREVREVRAAFVQEVRGNRDLLASGRYLPYHRRMWEHYRAMGKAADAGDSALLATLQKENSVRFGNGVWPTPLRDAVWRSLSQSDLLRHMQANEVFILADTYREQESIDRWHERMFTIWSEPRSDKEHPAFVRAEIHSTRSYLADVVAAEERLLKHYDEALRQLARPAR
jgi:hypothetical protein